MKLHIIYQAKVLQLTQCSQCIFWDVGFQLSPGSVATDPVVWYMLQHLTPVFKHLLFLNYIRVKLHSQMNIKLTDDPFSRNQLWLLLLSNKGIMIN